MEPVSTIQSAIARSNNLPNLSFQGLTLISLSDDNGRRGEGPSVLDQRKKTSRRQTAPARAARFGPRVDLLMSIGMANFLLSRSEGVAME